MGISTVFLLEAQEPVTVSKLTKNPHEVLIVIGAIFCIAIVATLFVVAFRKRHRRHSHHHHYHRSRHVEAHATHSTRHRRRRERYTHRNPTLAETGGLPPKRTQPPATPHQPQSQLQQPQSLQNA